MLKIIYFLLLLSSYLAIVSSTGYITYHLYSKDYPLIGVSCSDGKNGLITRWGISDLQTLYPYVTAFSDSQWNSPNCGKCVRLQTPTKTVFVTVIDSCGPAPSGLDAHFDVAPEVFSELFGSTTAGVGQGEWTFVRPSLCDGNKG